MKRRALLSHAGLWVCYLTALASCARATEVTRDITAKNRWLNFPLSDTAPLHQVEVLCDGKEVRYFMAQLDPQQPRWWSSLDIGTWKGSKLTIRINDAPADPGLLATIDQTDESKELGPELYREALRPLYHFSARRGWLNDPNGMVYCDGQWHLFFQHNPFAWLSSSKHWGHAVSSDLVHWREVGEALYPTSKGQMYSGSAVVDRANSSGLVAGSKTPLILVYTNAAGRDTGQCLASTLDGVTFDKFAGNPVLPIITGPNRDPRAFWYEPTKSWVLAVYVGIPDPLQPDKPHSFHDAHTVRLYTSKNLRDWVQTDEIKGGKGGENKFLYECPDLFPLPVPGKPGEVKWIIQGGSGVYLIGNFDGAKFTPDSPTPQLNRYGGDFYAAQTFTNAPNGRIVQIGWMRANTPGMPFNQCMSVPLDLSLQEDATGLHLAYAPVEELKALRGAPIEIPPGPLGAENALASVRGDSFDFEAEIKPGTAQKIVFKFRGLEMTYDVATQALQCKKVSAPVPLEQGVLKLRMMLDRVTLDIFAAHGAVYAPVYFLPPASDLTQSLTAVGGSAEIVSLKAYPMASSWLP